MPNDILVCLALGAALGALASFVMYGGFDGDLALNMTLGGVGALIGDGLGLPAIGIVGAETQAVDAARIAASVVGAILLLAAVQLHSRYERG
jgi:uncharacterized membrane protein YeaQ/YmgE (transglycosylase-associated protein family)